MQTLIKDSVKISVQLRLIMAFVLGLCFCAHLTFYSFLIFGKFQSWAVSLVPGLALLYLIYINQTYIKRKLINDLNPHIEKRQKIDFIAGGLWSILIFAIVFHAAQHPFGEWDAWAIWNLKTKFLLLSASPFEDIFRQLHWHTHPDYPLLLPFINVWVASFFDANIQPGSFITAVLLSISCGILLFAGLNMFIPKSMAVTASLLLLAHPYFIFFSTNQYADTLLSILILAMFISLRLFFDEQKRSLAALCGVWIGLLTFVKNEGILMALIMYVVLNGYMIFKQKSVRGQWTSFLKPMLIGTIAAAMPAIIFKIFLSPPNDDIIPHLQISFANLFNQQALGLIVNAVWFEIVDKRWCFLWIMLSVMAIFKIKYFLKNENLVFTLFLMIFFLAVLSVYFFSEQAELGWWLKSSLRRIYFYLLPTSIFMVFHSFWASKEKS